MAGRHSAASTPTRKKSPGWSRSTTSWRPGHRRENRLVGVITVDDVVDVIQDEATEDIHGWPAYSDERVFTPPGERSPSGLPWLAVNLVTAFIAARSSASSSNDRSGARWPLSCRSSRAWAATPARDDDRHRPRHRAGRVELGNSRQGAVQGGAGRPGQRPGAGRAGRPGGLADEGQPGAGRGARSGDGDRHVHRRHGRNADSPRICGR